MRSPLRELAAAQHGAFSTAQAMRCYSRSELRARLASERWVTVFAGAHRTRGARPTARLLVSAAGLSVGREVPACLHTAAALHGFGVLDDATTHVAVHGEAACLRRAELWPHQLLLAPRDLVRLRCGTLVTTADRTAVDLARTLPRIDVLPVLDMALESGACSPESLAAELVRHVGQRGVRQARELLPLAATGPESPQESRMRLLCHDAGLPAPTIQLPVCDARGRPTRWLDLGWEKAKVGLEYDGEAGHDGATRRRSDRKRHNWFADDDWTMFYATDLDIYRGGVVLMSQVAAAISRRSWADGR